MKGRVDVIKKGIEARFSWRPDPDGTRWDQESLRAILALADVKVEVSPAVLDEALAFFESHPEPAETGPVATGVEPVRPMPMTVRISAAELPPEVAAVLSDIIRTLPPIEGSVGYGWSEKNSSVGVVSPPVSARPGLALNRDPIPPPELEGEDFRIGENLEIRGSSLIALVEGIVRTEGNWADMIPCPRHSWSLEGGADEGACLLNYSPGHSAIPLPSATDVILAAGQLGYLPDGILGEQEIRAVLATAVSDGREITRYPISRDTDGLVRVEIDRQRILAQLLIRRESGQGKILALADVSREIRNSSLRGFDAAAVKTAIMNFWNSGESSAVLTLKEGRAAERGPDRELEFLVPFLEEQHLSPVRRRFELEPWRTRGIRSLKDLPANAVTKMAIVSAGHPVARLGSAKPGKPGMDIDDRELPGIPGNDPDIEVHEGLKWDGDSLIALTDGVVDVGRTANGITHLRLRPHRDAEIRITISDDKFKAMVSTRPSEGTGAPVSPERILSAAEAAGVVKGLLEDALADVTERCLTGEIVTGYLIAEGRLPMADNTRLSLAVNGDPAKAPIPVKTGDLIGTLRGGDPGGWNVLGEPLLDEGGVLKEGDNIRRNTQEDGTILLVAERGGHLVLSEGRLLIRHLLDFVGDISMVSGNVRFPGRIKIEGSVLSRVVVDGGEGVDISEVVQAALVNSGGDVQIGKGVKGEGKAVIRAQGRLILGYAEDANLLSTGDIIVKRALMNCRVKCNGRLEFSGSEGRLIGGILKLKNGLVCHDVGNERGTETVVSFGQDYLVDNQIETAGREQRKIQEVIDKTDRMMAELEKKGSPSKLILVRQKKIEALRILEKKTRLLFLLREKYELHFQSEIRISGTAWPGVTFESHGRLIKVEQPLRSVVIVFNPEKGRLEKRPLR